MLQYREVYKGIHVRYYGTSDQLKYDWLLDAGADPDLIRTAYSENVEIRLNQGRLEVLAPTGTIYEEPPKAYQYVDGVRKEVKCQFRIEGQTVSFKLGKYDPSRPLIIDPVVVFSSYSGSTADNWGFTATYDDNGALYGGGVVFDIGYPIKGNAIQASFNSLPPWNLDMTTDIGLSKWNPAGTNLVYSTYIGGDGVDQPHSMIVNSQNQLLITGATSSSDFPVRQTGYQNSFQGGSTTGVNGIQFDGGSDIYVIKINSAGSAITGGTFLGGSGNDGLNKSLALNYGDVSRGEVIVDSVDNVYIVSTTTSTNYPVSGSASQTTKGSGQDAVVSKLNSNLSSLLWSTYFGGNSEDAGYSLKVNTNGDIYICGGTKSSNLAGTSGSINPSDLGLVDGFIARFNEPRERW